MTKRTIILAVVAAAVALGGVAVAQGPGLPPGHPPMGTHMMQGGQGMMGPGRMGGGGMGMGCGFMEPGAQVKVEKLKNGASITVTSSDPKVAARIQKRAEIWRLMHELEEEEAQGQ